MGRALEVVTGRVLNPGATITALTANTGNTFAIRAFPDSARAFMEGLWGHNATAGVIRVRSPRMHDFTQGIRYANAAGVVRNLLTDYSEQRLFPTDTLTFEQSGGGAETDSAAFLVYYSDLGGADAKLAMWDAIKPAIVNLLTVTVNVTGPATAGDWSAGNALTGISDLLKADTFYAVLGYTTDTLCTAVAIQGPDTANYRAGGPGPVEPIETRDWFVSMSEAHKTPHIPVINSQNDGNTLVSVCRNTAAGTIVVDLSLAELTSFSG